MHSPIFNVGDHVFWTFRNRGANYDREGTVFALVPAGDTVISALKRHFRIAGMTDEDVTRSFDIDPIEVTGLPYEDVRYIVLVESEIGRRGRRLRPKLYCPRVGQLRARRDRSRVKP